MTTCWYFDRNFLLETRVYVISNVMETRQNYIQHMMTKISWSLEEVGQTITSFEPSACLSLLLAPNHFLFLVFKGGCFFICIVYMGR